MKIPKCLIYFSVSGIRHFYNFSGGFASLFGTVQNEFNEMQMKQMKTFGARPKLESEQFNIAVENLKQTQARQVPRG